MRTAISCKFPVSIPPDLSPGPQNGPVSLPGNILSIFVFFIIPSSWGSLREKGGMGSVYLDGWVMGSSYWIKYRFYRESPKSQNLDEVDIIWPAKFHEEPQGPMDPMDPMGPMGTMGPMGSFKGIVGKIDRGNHRIQ